MNEYVLLSLQKLNIWLRVIFYIIICDIISVCFAAIQYAYVYVCFFFVYVFVIFDAIRDIDGYNSYR